MTKRTTSDRTEKVRFLCCFQKKVKQISVDVSSKKISTKTFIRPPEGMKIKRFGCIVEIPAGHPKEGMYIVLDSFVGLALLYDKNGKFVAVVDKGNHLKRSFDMVFVDRDVYPFQGKGTVQNGISLLIFNQNGILEYNESGKLVRTINTADNSLLDCNMAFLTPQTLQ